jgi:two-component system, OmpR family, response regulator CpxR
MSPLTLLYARRAGNRRALRYNLCVCLTPESLELPTGTPDHPTGHLLIIDDDVEFCRLISDYLEGEGFEVEAVHQAEQGVERALSQEHALVVLDVMLPGFNGFEALRRIRARSSVPVLMLTARGEDVDRIVGLEIGADDYLSKPFNHRELVARIHAILRRTARMTTATGLAAPSERLVVADVELDPGAHIVRCKGRPIELTGVEFSLLEALLRSAGRVVEREDLSRAVLGRRLQPFDRSLDVHVSNLRKKLGHMIGDVERIATVRGVGYIYALVSGRSGDSKEAGVD